MRNTDENAAISYHLLLSNIALDPIIEFRNFNFVANKC